MHHVKTAEGFLRSVLFTLQWPPMAVCEALYDPQFSWRMTAFGVNDRAGKVRSLSAKDGLPNRIAAARPGTVGMIDAG